MKSMADIAKKQRQKKEQKNNRIKLLLSGGFKNDWIYFTWFIVFKHWIYAWKIEQIKLLFKEETIMKQEWLWQIQEFCWKNYATVDGFLENLEWELRGKKIAKIENETIYTTDGKEISFNEII